MSDRVNAYFAKEALEYLDELDALLAGSLTPPADHFFRLTTGVRGSAQMAEVDSVGPLAEALEDVARGLAAGSVRWSEELHSLSVGAVHDLKEMIGALVHASPPSDELRDATEGRMKPDVSGPAGRAIPISELFYDDEGPHILESDRAPADGGAAGVVPIGELLFAGESALREAMALRPRIEEAARQGHTAHLDILLEELFDLVELGMGSDPNE